LLEQCQDQTFYRKTPISKLKSNDAKYQPDHSDPFFRWAKSGAPRSRFRYANIIMIMYDCWEMLHDHSQKNDALLNLSENLNTGNL
jgi:hypothetical protein